MGVFRVMFAVPSFVCLVTLIGLMSPANSFPSGHSDRVLLENVQTLTFRRGERTTGRRSAPVAQLACVSGDCGEPVDVVQCTNVGLGR